MRQAPGQSLGSRHAAAAQDHLHRHIVRNPSRQALNPASIGQKAPLHLRKFEIGILRHQDDIRCEGDLETTADGGAIDRRDQGLLEIPKLGDAAKATGTVTAPLLRLAFLIALACLDKIPAGTENPIALGRQQADPQIGIVLQQLRCLIESPAKCAIDGIYFRPVQRDQKH